MPAAPSQTSIHWLKHHYQFHASSTRLIIIVSKQLSSCFPTSTNRCRTPNTRKALRRWFDEGLVDYRKFLFAERGYVWLTHKGMQAAQLSYKPYLPAEGSLTHLHALNQLHLKLEEHLEENNSILDCLLLLYYALQAHEDHLYFLAMSAE